MRDGKYFSLGEDPSPFIYVNLRPTDGSYLTLMVRTSSEPQAVIGALRNEFHQLDSNLPVYSVRTMTEHMALPLFPARVAATLLGSFGLAGVDSCGDRNLWCYVLRGEPAHSRDRHSDGAGRGCRQDLEAGDRTRLEADLVWSGDRPCWRVCRNAVDVELCFME